MSCFVLGCSEPVAWTSNLVGAPMLFKHPRFGEVQACEDHGRTLEMVTSAYEDVRKAAVVIRCVECGKRPCVCASAGRSVTSVKEVV